MVVGIFRLAGQLLLQLLHIQRLGLYCFAPAVDRRQIALLQRLQQCRAQLVTVHRAAVGAFRQVESVLLIRLHTVTAVNCRNIQLLFQRLYALLQLLGRHTGHGRHRLRFCHPASHQGIAVFQEIAAVTCVPCCVGGFLRRDRHTQLLQRHLGGFFPVHRQGDHRDLAGIPALLLPAGNGLFTGQTAHIHAQNACMVQNPVAAGCHRADDRTGNRQAAHNTADNP